MTQHSTPRPDWLLLADEAFTRLRDQAETGTPAFPFARGTSGKRLTPSVVKETFAKMIEEEQADAGLEPFVTDFDIEERRIGPPAPDPVIPFRMHPDPRHLQALLRLARAFGSVAGWRAGLAPGALTLIETGERWLLDTGYIAIKHGFAGELEIAEMSSELGDLALHRIPGQRGRTRAGAGPTSDDVDMVLESILANPIPAIVLVESREALSAAQQAVFGRIVTLPPLGRALVAAHVALADLRIEGWTPEQSGTLPPDDVLATLDMITFAHALRADRLADLRARLAPPPDPAKTRLRPTPAGPTLAELPIPAELKEMLTQVGEDLRAWKDGTLDWSEIARGALLVGPPGVGKTETGRALARSADIAFVECSLSAGLGLDKHLGETLGRIKAAFDQARKLAPSILFLDELDAVGDRATSHGHNSGWERRFITGLNEMLDGFTGREGVFVIGTANHPEQIDAALVRSGRFDRKLHIGLPDRQALAQILGLHAGLNLTAVKFDDLAGHAIGLSGADVAAAVRAARGLARARREVFAEMHLEEILGAKRRLESPALIRRIAIHEAGHAIVAQALEHPDPVKIAFVGEGAETSYARSTSSGTRAERDARLATMMAGREAERLILGEIAEGSGGSAVSDLAQATLMVLREELSFGLGGSGVVWIDDAPDPAVWFLRDPALKARVEARLAEAAEVARVVLETRREVIERVAAAVAERRELEGDRLRALLSAQGDCHP